MMVMQQSKVLVADLWVLGLVTALSIAVRCYQISYPPSSVWDEQHFVNFVGQYLQRRFFFDLHPPLAKLVFASVAWLAGSDGQFVIRGIGDPFDGTSIPYVALRLTSATCGILLVPVTYALLRASQCHSVTATIGACLVIFENSLITTSRLIILDPQLLLCIALTALSWTRFLRITDPALAFKSKWWFWLASTGISLGLTMSIKWVGLFTVAWVGILTIVQLWQLLRSSDIVIALWHFIARVVCLIITPASIYLLAFGIHFRILQLPGEGDGFMSHAFQANLQGNGIHKVPADIAIGSDVSLRLAAKFGGYLSAGLSLDPVAGQSVIGLNSVRDQENFWTLSSSNNLSCSNRSLDGDPLVRAFSLAAAHETIPWIADGANVRLYHQKAGQYLHPSDLDSVMATSNTCSAQDCVNDTFRVEVVETSAGTTKLRHYVRAIEMRFALIHTGTGCVLSGTPNRVCKKRPCRPMMVECVHTEKRNPWHTWYVEQNTAPPQLRVRSFVNHDRLGFLRKFTELQKTMWTKNAALTEAHNFESRPEAWPVLRRGMGFWAEDHSLIHLFGNPLIWWSSTAAVVLCVTLSAVNVLQKLSGFTFTRVGKTDWPVPRDRTSMVLAWALHFFPFFLMKRQLFIHHYLPALFFAIMTLCQVFDEVALGNRRSGIGSSRRLRIGAAGGLLFVVASVYVFFLYSPMIYGSSWTRTECQRYKLLRTWNWKCHWFDEN